MWHGGGNQITPPGMPYATYTNAWHIIFLFFFHNVRGALVFFFFNLVLMIVSLFFQRSPNNGLVFENGRALQASTCGMGVTWKRDDEPLLLLT